MRVKIYNMSQEFKLIKMRSLRIEAILSQNKELSISHLYMHHRLKHQTIIHK